MNAKLEPSAEKKALADALLELDGRTVASTAEGRALAGRILRRDRLRVRLLTGSTIVLFLLAIAGIYWNFHLAKTEIYSKIWQCQEQMFGHGATKLELQILTLVQEAYISQFKSILMASLAFGGILAAAVCTLLLILATRRATLRQIQTNLVLLSKQIEMMRKSVQVSPSSGETSQKPDAG
jgi:hypothetical protein